MLTGLRITLDGHLETVTIDNTTASNLILALHRAIGCELFDSIALPDHIALYVGGDVRRHLGTFNPALTLVAAQLGAHEPIYGPGIFLRRDPITGDLHTLTRAQAKRVVGTHLITIIHIVRDILEGD